MKCGYLFEVTDGNGELRIFEAVNPKINGHFQKRRNFSRTKNLVTIFRMELSWDSMEELKTASKSEVEQAFDFINETLNTEPNYVKVSYYEAPTVILDGDGHEIYINPDDIDLFTPQYYIYTPVESMQIHMAGYDLSPFGSEIVESFTLQLEQTVTEYNDFTIFDQQTTGGDD